MKLVDCTLERHGPAILEIFNEAIANSTALWDYAQRSPESMVGWFADKAAGGWPVVGLEQGSQLLGFATYGSFRAREAYRYSVEHSVYVHHAHRGQGHGTLLLKTLIDRATDQGIRLMVGGIDASNLGSISLHERLGFTHAGTIDAAGYKFGRWLDLAFYQLLLPGPAEPREG